MWYLSFLNGCMHYVHVFICFMLAHELLILTCNVGLTHIQEESITQKNNGCYTILLYFIYAGCL